MTCWVVIVPSLSTATGSERWYSAASPRKPCGVSSRVAVMARGVVPSLGWLRRGYGGGGGADRRGGDGPAGEAQHGGEGDATRRDAVEVAPGEEGVDGGGGAAEHLGGLG